MPSPQEHTPGPPPERLLDALDSGQRAAASGLHGPVCILAGAGTGKTRAITHRIAYGVGVGAYAPTAVLALTYTARAAGEMRSRLRDLGAYGVSARTFHAAALRQLQYFWGAAFGGEMPPLVEHKAKLVAHAASVIGVSTDRATIRDLAAEIEWCKVSMLPATRYAAAAAAAGREGAAGLDAVAVARVMVAYEQIKTDQRLLDFEDVLVTCAAMLEQRPDIADTVRRQYRHFVVDEYQDVSKAQHHLLRTWLGDRRDVCVVGDAGQTIYSFAGANPRYLIDFGAEFEDADVVRLTTNYRCTPNIVRLANGILAGAPRSHQRGYVRLESPAQPHENPTVMCLASDDEEASWVATQVAARIGAGVPAQEIAVLFRTNGQAAAFEQALTDRAVPYVVRGGERFFARPEVRNAIVLLRGAARASEPGNLVADVRAILAGAGYTDTAPTQAGAVRSQWESLHALVKLAEHMAENRRSASVADMVKELDDRAESQHAPTVDGVTLASLHSTKGLEWDVVFVAGAHDGIIPIGFAETADEIEEERRLLYVGCTRARRDLVITYALSRSGSGGKPRALSRFLQPAKAGLSLKTSRAASGVARTRRSVTCRVCGQVLSAAGEIALRRCTDCPSSCDENVLAALKAWRLDTSRTASVPAFVVFGDATLIAIAENDPQNLEELSAVHGVGPAKLEKYGPDVLDVLRDVREKQGVGGA